MNKSEKFFVNSNIFNFIYKITIYNSFLNFIDNFKNNSFDCIIETNVLHHIRNYENAIKEIRRVLKNKGYFYLMDISQYFFGLPFFKILFPPESYITKNILIQKLEEHNFKVEKSKGCFIFFIAAKKIQK